MIQPIHLNISSVERVEASALANAQLLPGWRIFVGSLIYWEPICIFGYAQLTISDKMDNQQRIFSAQLQFLTDSLLVTNGRQYAYRLTTVNGKQYIMGLNQPPFTVLTNSVSMPKDPKNKSGNTVSISLQGPIPPLLYIG